MRIKFATTRLKAFFADADVGDDDELLVVMVMMVMNIMVMMTEADQVCNNQAAKPLFL